MKCKGLWKRFFCLCAVPVLISSTMAQAAAGVSNTIQPQRKERALMQKQNDNLYTQSTPCIVAMNYPRRNIVVADIIATQAPYFADNSGRADCTLAIQRAVDECYAAGGGTVFLPAGKYLLTAGITVPGFVTLRGDWQDPDTGTDYGTIIMADVASTADNLPALFTINGSAGVMGLTVFYPGQDINHVKPYPFTFYVPGEMLQSIVNCTVINGYKGIGACVDGGVHEMMTVENVKGTFLHCGAMAYNQSDVGTWKNLTISNRYWAQAGAGLCAAPRESIDAYTRVNTTGFILGDLEWTQFANIEIADCKYGMHMVKGKRIEFAGSLFDVKIERCDVGVQVDSMDTRWGMIIAKSRINGSKNAIVNNTFGMVKIAGTELSGGRVGGRLVFKDIGEFFDFIKSIFKYGFHANRKYIFDFDSLDTLEVDYDAAPFVPADHLFVVQANKTGQQDATPAIQASLDQAAVSGGVVYLPAGKYRMDGPVTVPAGVELRGASSVATRDQNANSRGTVILAYHGLNPTNPDRAPALITLAANAGVSGVRIFYPENSCVRPGAFGTVQPCAYAVRGTGSGVYAVNVAIAAAYNGVDFRECDNHYIKKLVTCCYSNAIFAGGRGGTIEGCLQNGTVMARNGLNLPNWIDEGSQMFPYLFDAVTRVQTEYIRLSGAQDQRLYNCFAYGVKSFMVNENSTDLLAFNIGADNIGGTMLGTRGGSATIINMMRWNGTSFTNDDTALTMYNRLTIGDKTEKTVKAVMKTVK